MAISSYFNQNLSGHVLNVSTHQANNSPSWTSVNIGRPYHFGVSCTVDIVILYCCLFRLSLRPVKQWDTSSHWILKGQKKSLKSVPVKLMPCYGFLLVFFFTLLWKLKDRDKQAKTWQRQYHFFLHISNMECARVIRKCCSL